MKMRDMKYLLALGIAFCMLVFAGVGLMGSLAVFFTSENVPDSTPIQKTQAQPVAAMTSVSIEGYTQPSTNQFAGQPSAPMYEPFPVSDDEISMYLLVNNARAQAGQSKLYLDISLLQSARDYSQNMRDIGYFGHSTGPGRLGLSENISHTTNDTPADRHKGYMDSPAHMNNLMSPQWTRVGIGEVMKYFNDAQRYEYWNTERFDATPVVCVQGLEAAYAATTTTAFVSAWNEHATLCSEQGLKLVTSAFWLTPQNMVNKIAVALAPTPIPDQGLEQPQPPAVPEAPQQTVPTPHPLVPGNRDELEYLRVQATPMPTAIPQPTPLPQYIYVYPTPAPAPPPQIVYIYPTTVPQPAYVAPVQQYQPPAQQYVDPCQYQNCGQQQNYGGYGGGGTCTDHSPSHGTWNVGDVTPGGWKCLPGNQWECVQSQCASARVPNGSYQGLVNPGW